MVLDQILVGARSPAPIQTGPGAHPASYSMGTGSFPGVKRPGRGIDHPPQSRAELKERVELYLYSLSGRSWSVLGWTLPSLLPSSKSQKHVKLEVENDENKLWKCIPNFRFTVLLKPSKSCACVRVCVCMRAHKFSQNLGATSKF